jgi:hypothetical protein
MGPAAGAGRSCDSRGQRLSGRNEGARTGRKAGSTGQARGYIAVQDPRHIPGTFPGGR